MIYKYLAIGAFVCVIVWAIDDFGYDRAANEWQVKLDDRENKIKDAKIAHQKELLELQSQLNNVNQVNEYVQQQVYQLENTNRSLSVNIDSLRESAKKYAATIKRYANDPAFAGTGKTTATGPDLLAELFGKSVERNQQLAVEADRYRIAGLACEKAYATVEQLINKKPAL
jgi:septal ring factor EnvC (AmiA/AmiB activator)